MRRHTYRKLISIAGLILISIGAARAQEAKPPAEPLSAKHRAAPQKIVEQGIAIEFTADPLAPNAKTIRAAEDVNVRFKVTDTTTGTPVKGLGLSAWINMRPKDKPTEPAQCRE